jgi:plastocyanin
MSKARNDEMAEGKDRRPVSTRRGFVAAASFGAVSLYGLWAAYGASPLRFRAGEAAVGGGHAGHGGARGPDPEEFRRMTEAFVASHRQADGTVWVDAPATGEAMAGTATGGGHEAHHATGQAAPDVEAPEVLILAQRWAFEPSDLRLRAGAAYRFKLMAVDSAHGASLQLGGASHVIRLPRGVLVERELRFTRQGEYLLYCTVYCGEAHQYMSAKLRVV